MGRSVVALQCFPSSVRRKREEAYHKLPCVPEGLVTSVRSVHISCFCSILSGIILGYVEKCFLDRGLPILLPLSLVSSSIPLSFSSPCPRSTIRFPLLIPLILNPITRRGRNMSSFLANFTSALMQPPCSSHDFDPRNHRHSTRCLPFSSASLLGQIISERTA